MSYFDDAELLKGNNTAEKLELTSPTITSVPKVPRLWLPGLKVTTPSLVLSSATITSVTKVARPLQMHLNGITASLIFT